jgi:hypothetical protein
MDGLLSLPVIYKQHVKCYFVSLCMLSLKEFNALHESRQAEAIWNETFLAGREENGLVVRLYSLGAFYGEVFYYAHTNKRLRLKAFDTTSQLEPYLAHINLH